MSFKRRSSSSALRNKTIAADVENKTDTKDPIRCEECDLPFWSDVHLERHRLTHKRAKEFTCPHCSKRFARRNRMQMHSRTCDEAPVRENASNPAPLQVGGGVADKFELVENSLRGGAKVYRLAFPQGTDNVDFVRLHEMIAKDVPELVQNAKGLFKWYLGLKVIFQKATNPDIVTDPPIFFITDPVASYESHSDSEIWKFVKEQLMKQIDNYQMNGSGWIVHQMMSLDVNMIEMENPLHLTIEDISDDEIEHPDEYVDERRYDNDEE